VILYNEKTRGLPMSLEERLDPSRLLRKVPLRYTPVMLLLGLLLIELGILGMEDLNDRLYLGKTCILVGTFLQFALIIIIVYGYLYAAIISRLGLYKP
jgi:hypothetical protein